MYHDNPSSRSPGLHRQPSSSHFDPYSAAPNPHHHHHQHQQQQQQHHHQLHQHQHQQHQPHPHHLAPSSVAAAASAPSLYDDPSGPAMSRYDSVRLDHLHHISSSPAAAAAAAAAAASSGSSSAAPGNPYPYDFSGSQTWNVTTPGVFGGSLAGLAAAAGGGSGAMTSHVKPQGRGARTALPSTWLDQAGLNSGPFSMGSSPGMSGPGPASNPQQQHHQLLQPAQLRADAMTPTPSHHDGTEDELIPTAIVIKNIPFAVKKEQLVQLMTELNLPLPYAFNYHFDNGVFRGLAFANFTSSEETAAVIDVLNHYELHGRKLRVEYKKMLPYHERERIEREKREKRGQLEEQHRPLASHQLHTQPSMSSLPGQMHAGGGNPSPAPARNRLEVDMNDPDTLRVYTELFLFKNDLSRDVLIFPPTLSPIQRRTVHTLAHNLGLSHSSRGNGSERAVHVFRSTLPPPTATGPGPTSGGLSLSPSNAALSAAAAGSGPGNGPSHLQPVVDGRRGLNRAATIDFSEARAEGVISPFSGAPRTQPSTGFLNVMDSAGFGGHRGGGGLGAGAGAGLANGLGGMNGGGPQNLRAAKSFADLRSYSPSPALSTSSFPAAALQSNVSTSRYGAGTGGYDVNTVAAAAAAAMNNNASTPNMTPTPSGSSLGNFQRSATQEDIFTPLSQLSLGTGISAGASSSPRRLRGMFSWDTTTAENTHGHPHGHGHSTPASSSASPIAGSIPAGGLGSSNATPMSMNGGAGDNGGAGAGGVTAPIGSQRGAGANNNGAVGTGYDGQERMRSRQVSGGYSSRTRSSNGHQTRNSDEMRGGSGRNGVEIIVE